MLDDVGVRIYAREETLFGGCAPTDWVQLL